MKRIIVTGTVLKHPGSGGLFVELTKNQSKIVRKMATGIAWGSVRIHAVIGKTEWETMFFPTKSGSYIISLKKTGSVKNLTYTMVTR